MNREQRNYYNEIHVNHGWAVSAQFKDWVNGEPLSEMNENALAYIVESLRSFDDDLAIEYADEIEEFLTNPTPSPDHPE